MKNIFKIAWRNLFRYKRRTLLTGSLIAIGVIFMLVFSGVGNSFKEEVIGSITNASLGDLEIHAAGYLDSMDNLPLDLTLKDDALPKIEAVLKADARIKAYSLRLRLGAMLSNFQKTTSVRMTAVIPEAESQTCPDLPKRIVGRTSNDPQFFKPGEILIPVNLAKGLNLAVGSDAVVVATNQDGSVNGLNLRVGGIAENAFGPTGKDAYMHLEDARALLRIEGQEVIEIAIKLKQFDQLNTVYRDLKAALDPLKNAEGHPLAEVHTWEQLSPFKTIARMVDLLIVMIRVVLIAIVLISVLNVMLMSVYERISEIGTIASIGTPPNRILALFLVEGMSLGLISGVIGSLSGMGILLTLNVVRLNLTFGQIALSLSPRIPFGEVFFTIGIVVVISAISSFQPANKAARLEPVEALRHV